VRKLSISTSVDHDMIRADVADTGCGLSASAYSDLFMPFTSTKSSGLGVGLSITRSIVEAHYGMIWADAKPGGGAMFSFTLPLASAGVADKQAPKTHPEPRSKAFCRVST